MTETGTGTLPSLTPSPPLCHSELLQNAYAFLGFQMYAKRLWAQCPSELCSLHSAALSKSCRRFSLHPLDVYYFNMATLMAEHILGMAPHCQGLMQAC